MELYSNGQQILCIHLKNILQAMRPEEGTMAEAFGFFFATLLLM